MRKLVLSLSKGYSILILLTSLLLFSCRSSDSFSHRKYLPGVFRTQSSESRSVIAQKSEQATETSTKVASGVKQPPAEVLPQEKLLEEEVDDYESQVPVICNVELSSLQPQDTLPKSKRQQRREYRRTDQYRSAASLSLGIRSIISAVLFTLIGLWLGSGGARRFTDDIILLIFLIIFIVPFYIALGVSSLIGSLLSVFFARKVRSKHQGEETYEGEKETRMGIILSIVGLALLIIGAILTLPHFLDW